MTPPAAGKTPPLADRYELHCWMLAMLTWNYHGYGVGEFFRAWHPRWKDATPKHILFWASGELYGFVGAWRN